MAKLNWVFNPKAETILEQLNLAEDLDPGDNPDKAAVVSALFIAYIDDKGIQPLANPLISILIPLATDMKEDSVPLFETIKRLAEKIREVYREETIFEITNFLARSLFLSEVLDDVLHEVILNHLNQENGNETLN